MFCRGRSGGTALSELFLNLYSKFVPISYESLNENNTSIYNFLKKNERYFFKSDNKDLYKKLINNESFNKENVLEYINVFSELSTYMEYKYVLLKVTPAKRNLINKIGLKYIVNDKNSEVFFFFRNILDIYISSLKAKEVKTWSNVDTTKIILKIDKEKFYDFYKSYVKWIFTNIEELKYTKNVMYFNYEDIFNNKKEIITKFLKSFNDLIAVNDYRNDHNNALKVLEKFTKQDKSINWKNKISNSDEIDEFIRSKNIILNPSKIISHQ